MKEKIIEILESYQAKGLDRIRNVKNLSGWISPAGIPLIAAELEPLINQEVEKRIKERMPSNPDLMQEFEGAYGYLSNPTKRQIWRHSLWAIELFQRRLINTESSQKTEGGE